MQEEAGEEGDVGDGEGLDIGCGGDGLYLHGAEGAAEAMAEEVVAQG